MNGIIRLAWAELRKPFTTKALPVSFAIAIVLAAGSVLLDAMVAGKNGQPRLGTDESTYKMLKVGAVTCAVMLILGILAAGSEFRHRTIIPVLLATPHRMRVFAVKVAVIAGLSAVFSAVVFGAALVTIVLTLSAHGIHHLPAGAGTLYLGSVIASACFGMIGVALGALTRNTIGAIIVAITWALFIESVMLTTLMPSIEKWLPVGASVGLMNAPGPGSLSPAVAGVILTGYAISLLALASRTTIRRDIA